MKITFSTLSVLALLAVPHFKTLAQTGPDLTGSGSLDDSAGWPLFYRWQVRPSGTANHLTGIAYSGSQYVAVGSNHVALSTDGRTWMVRNTPSYSLGKAKFYDVACGPGQFVAVGKVAYGEGFSSADAITWKRLGIDTPKEVTSVAHGASCFTAVKFHDQALVWATNSDLSLWVEVYDVGDAGYNLGVDLYDVTYDEERGLFAVVSQAMFRRGHRFVFQGDIQFGLKQAGRPGANEQ